MITDLVVDRLELFDHVDDILHLREEPRVDPSQGAQPRDGVVLTVVESSCHSKDTFVSWVDQLLKVEGEVVVLLSCIRGITHTLHAVSGYIHNTSNFMNFYFYHNNNDVCIGGTCVLVCIHVS